MANFALFLEFFTLLLSMTSLVLVYMAVRQCKESVFVPIYYFISLSLGATMVLSIARIGKQLAGPGFPMSSALIQDLFISYIVLFLFGSMWQSYEASICVPDFVEKE